MNSQGDQRVACRVGPVRYMRLALVALVCRELTGAQSHESPLALTDPGSIPEREPAGWPECCQHRRHTCLPEDPEHRELEGDDTDTEAEACEWGKRYSYEHHTCPR